MATRFYCPSTGPAIASPAFTASWDDVGPADRVRMVTTKIGSPMSQRSNKCQTWGDACLIRQYVSDPLTAQTITGTIKGIIRAKQSSVGYGNVDAAKLIVRVVSNDGSTVRGTLFADTDALASAWPTTLTNRKFPRAYAGSGGTLTSVAALADDRIVVEVGFYCAAAFQFPSGFLELGDTGTDLTENETGTTAGCPWIEFSQTLTFTPGGAPEPGEPPIPLGDLMGASRTNVEWRFALCDLLGAQIGDGYITQHMDNIKLQPVLNRPFALSFDVPSWHPLFNELHTDGDPMLAPKNRVVKGYRREVTGTAGATGTPMSVTSLTSGTDATDRTGPANPYVTASISPTANRLVILCFATSCSTAAPPTPTVTGGGLTWTLVREFQTTSTGSPRRAVFVYAAKTGASPGSGTVSIEHPSLLFFNGAWSITQWDGVDLTGTVASCFVQFADSAQDITGTTYSISLAAPANAANRAVHWGRTGVVGGTATPRASWTEIHEVAGETTQALQWRSDTFETTASVTFSGSSTTGGTAWELKGIPDTPATTSSEYVLRYAGTIEDIEDQGDPNTQRTGVTAFDPLHHLSRRLCRDGSNNAAHVGFQETDAAQIAKTLVERAHLIDGVGITTGDDAVFENTTNRTISFDYTMVATALLQLAESYGGFDLVLEPVDRTDGILTRLSVYASYGRDLEDVIVAYDTPPATASSANQRLFGSEMANYIIGLGAANQGADVIPVTQSDSTSITKYRRHEAVSTYTELTDTSFVTAAIQEELRFRKTPKRDVVTLPIAGRGFEPWTHAWLGDTIRARASTKLRGGYDGVQRIYGLTISVSVDGVETLESVLVAPA